MVPRSIKMFNPRYITKPSETGMTRDVRTFVSREVFVFFILDQCFCNLVAERLLYRRRFCACNCRQLRFAQVRIILWFGKRNRVAKVILNQSIQFNPNIRCWRLIGKSLRFLPKCLPSLVDVKFVTNSPRVACTQPTRGVNPESFFEILRVIFLRGPNVHRR